MAESQAGSFAQKGRPWTAEELARHMSSGYCVQNPVVRDGRAAEEVMEENGPENQCGFRPERGTIDGTFNLLMALRKRQEHNLETYVSFVDLVKAFDSVPRAALFKVLRRYGLPDHFINVVIRLHADAAINFKLGDEEMEVKNRIGVRQGACELSLIHI